MDRRVLWRAVAGSAILLLLSAKPSHAAMYGSVTGYPSGWPTYFSGTNCRVVGTVGAGSGAWLTDAQMYINYNLVRSYTDTGQHAPYVNWPVIFDSSIVTDATQLDFYVTGHNNLGGSITVHNQCLVYNKAYALGNNTLLFGVAAKDDVNTQAAGMNYQSLPSSVAAKSTILSTIPSQTAFYIYTHAGPGWFNDCPNTGTISAGDVSTAVNSKTTSQPQYDFVHIFGCNSCGSVGAEDTTLADAFHITGSDDQAFLGWLSAVKDCQTNESWSKTVWSGLKAGKTISRAVTEANAAYTPINADLSVATSKVFGDSRTTMHATYFLGPEGTWHD